MASEIYTAFDIRELGLLPIDWVEQIAHVVEEYAQHTVLDGTSSTAREPVPGEKMDVYVVRGDAIRDQLPWLYSLYENELLQLATTVAQQPVYPCANVVASININVLRGRGARYEWHVDSNPLTGMLYVTTHRCGDGGELVFEKDSNRTTVYPEAGIFIAFDARAIPHTVLPLRKDAIRLSIPMNYYHSKDQQVRPSGLDSYLYETSR